MWVILEVVFCVHVDQACRIKTRILSFELDLCRSPRSLQTMESLFLVKLNVTDKKSNVIIRAVRAYKYWGSRINWDPDRETKPCWGR